MKPLIILIVLIASLLIFIGSSCAANVQSMNYDIGHKIVSSDSIKNPIKTSTSLSATPTVGDALDNNKLIWRNDSGWRVQTDPTSAWDNVDDLTAGGYIPYSGISTCTLYTTVKGPGTLKFWWMTKTEGFASGVFTFYDNNIEKEHIHNVFWQPASYKVTNGTHTLKWTFTHQNFIDGDTYTSYCRMDTVEWISDTNPPKVISTIPTNFKTGVSRTSTIAIKFNENIKSSTYYNNIRLKNLSTGTYKTISKAISNNILYIKSMTKLYSNTWYQVIISKASIKDNSGNNLPNIYSFKFKTRTT